MQVLFYISQNSYFLRDNANFRHDNVCILLKNRVNFRGVSAKSERQIQGISLDA